MQRCNIIPGRMGAALHAITGSNISFISLRSRMYNIFADPIKRFHSIHNVVDGGVLRALWEELAGRVEQRRDQPVIC